MECVLKRVREGEGVGSRSKVASNLIFISLLQKLYGKSGPHLRLPAHPGFLPILNRAQVIQPRFEIKNQILRLSLLFVTLFHSLAPQTSQEEHQSSINLCPIEPEICPTKSESELSEFDEGHEVAESSVMKAEKCVVAIHRLLVRSF